MSVFAPSQPSAIPDSRNSLVVRSRMARTLRSNCFVARTPIRMHAEGFDAQRTLRLKISTCVGQHEFPHPFCRGKQTFLSLPVWDKGLHAACLFWHKKRRLWEWNGRSWRKRKSERAFARNCPRCGDHRPQRRKRRPHC